MDDLPKTKAYLSEKEKLPEDLHPHYDSLVKWYRHFAVIHHSHPWVSYKILADLVREGWRLSADPLEK